MNVEYFPIFAPASPTRPAPVQPPRVGTQQGHDGRSGAMWVACHFLCPYRKKLTFISTYGRFICKVVFLRHYHSEISFSIRFFNALSSSTVCLPSLYIRAMIFSKISTNASVLEPLSGDHTLAVKSL